VSKRRNSSYRSGRSPDWIKSKNPSAPGGEAGSRGLGSVAGQKQETFEPLTLGHIRSHGCRDLIVYCGSINCNHGITINADHMPDDTAIRSLGSRMVCTRCGHVGADVRPDWGPHVNKRRI
jgi:hypothetical protein